MGRRVAIVGGGAFGQVLAEYLCETQDVEMVGFLDDQEISGPRLGNALDPEAVEDHAIESLYISIGSGSVRSSLFQDYTKVGIQPATFVHPEAHVPRSVEIGSGSIVLSGVELMPLCSIEDCVFLSTGSGVAHHTRIGPASSIASGGRIGAGLHVGARVSFGVAAAAMTGVSRIGDDVVVGAGAVVIDDVPDGETVVGVPARPVSEEAG